jgi:hypothetical protein
MKKLIILTMSFLLVCSFIFSQTKVILVLTSKSELSSIGTLKQLVFTIAGTAIVISVLGYLLKRRKLLWWIVSSSAIVFILSKIGDINLWIQENPSPVFFSSLVIAGVVAVLVTREVILQKKRNKVN